LLVDVDSTPVLFAIIVEGSLIFAPDDTNSNHVRTFDANYIMISSPGDESCIGRLEWMELKDVGQAYKLGRYPIHYHMIGTVMSSYVQGNSIH